MRVLVTGAAGYIGSHTLLELLGQAHEVCVLDNYCNSSPVARDRVRAPDHLFQLCHCLRS